MSFLSNYISENINNPELTLEDIINDEEFLDELAKKDEKILELYLLTNLA
jgi:hypothetical protein